jgi:hypothetical protein
VDGDGNDSYDLGEGFRANPLANLDLYLLPANADDLSQSVWASTKLGWIVWSTFSIPFLKPGFTS